MIVQVHKYKLAHDRLFLRNKSGNDSGWDSPGYWYRQNFESLMLSGYEMSSAGLLFDFPLHSWED